jgi:hypothetical protein
VKTIRFAEPKNSRMVSSVPGLIVERIRFGFSRMPAA